MAEADVDALNGLYKEVYGDLVNAIPDAGVLLKMVKFDTSNKLGDTYHEMIILSAEQGYSYGGPDGAAFDLEVAVPMNSKDAVIGAFSYVMSSAISYTAASRAIAGGKAAFKSAISVVLGNAFESARKRLEISCIYGNTGIGDAPATVAQAEDTPTTTTVQFSASAWAPGIWSGAESAPVEFFGLVSGTLVSTGVDSVFTVKNVINSEKKVQFTGTATGIDALVVALDDAGVTVFYKGSKVNDMVGIKTIFRNTGLLFGIDGADFGLWRGQEFTAGGALTMEKVLTYVADLTGRGLQGDVHLQISPATWKDLNNEQSALRIYDSSYSSSRFENGSSEIVYYGLSGKILVGANPVIKEGDGFLFQSEDVKRIGSAETDNNIPTQDANPFFPIQGKAAFGFQYYTDQAIYARRPARTAVITGIVNQS